MKNILVVGGTGNIGRELIKYLLKLESKPQVFAGVRDEDKARAMFEDNPKLSFFYFNFEDVVSFTNITTEITSIFLLRPPHIADVEKYFRPLIARIKAVNVPELVFLSVQGVESSKVIPHYKIELLLKENELDFVSLRPSYFMQNLITTLYSDLLNRKAIILPAGKALFNWIDISNIAETAALLLDDFPAYKGQEIELTGTENLSFFEAVKLLNTTLNTGFEYININPLSFFIYKHRQGVSKAMIIVMIMLHFIPRFQKAPKISKNYQRITGKEATTLSGFVIREREMFLKANCSLTSKKN